MDSKLCLLFLALLGLAAANDCVQSVTGDRKFQQCMSDFGLEIVKLVMPKGGAEPGEGGGSAPADPEQQSTAMITGMCTGKARDHLDCIMSYLADCPDVIKSPAAAVLASLPPEAAAQGVGAMCESIKPECKQLQVCIGGAIGGPGRGGPDGGPMAGYETGNDGGSAQPVPVGSEMEGQSLYTMIVQQLPVGLCGQMKEVVDCMVAAEKECPDTIKFSEKMYKKEMNTQEGPSQKMSYSVMKEFAEEHCLTKEAFAEKKPCLMKTVTSADFIACYQNATVTHKIGQKEKLTCKASDALNACLVASVEPECGEKASDMLKAATLLFVPGMPSECQTAGSGGIQASLLTTALVAMLLAFFRFL